MDDGRNERSVCHEFVADIIDEFCHNNDWQSHVVAFGINIWNPRLQFFVSSISHLEL